jgi:hypothetical protein
MDWEQALINFGIVAGFLALMGFWLGLSMWMRVDADKRGLVGWVWIFIGLVTGPVGLIAYILYRGNRPVLEVVKQRDELISETSRAHMPVDYDPDAPPPTPPEKSPPVDPVKAALEAEERRYHNF